MIYEIIVHGPIPSKKNARNLFLRGGRIFNIPSDNYREWHKKNLRHLVLKNPVTNIQKIVMEFYFHDKRRRDLSNTCESVLDIMVDARVIIDDNYKIVPHLDLRYAGQDKFNPRCNVSIFTGGEK